MIARLANGVDTTKAGVGLGALKKGGLDCLKGEGCSHMDSDISKPETASFRLSVWEQ
jgi:hypothetical protein